MSTQRRNWKSPRLVLYGLVFRIVCSVALRALEEMPSQPPRQVERRHDAPAKGRSGLPLKLEPGQ